MPFVFSNIFGVNNFIISFFLLLIGFSANSQNKFISKEQAITKAEKLNCYSANKCSLILDSIKKVWIISRLDTTYYTKEGNCKNTNGCTIQLSTVLKLNAISGKQISKKKKKVIFANYE